MKPPVSRGHVWFVELDPVKGHEQVGRRPCLVVSVNPFNQGSAGLAIVLPMTTKNKHIRGHVRLEPPEGGLKKPSFVKCEDLRSVSTERLLECLGDVSEATMRSVENRLRILLGL